jgi:hypothetical protein
VSIRYTQRPALKAHLATVHECPAPIAPVAQDIVPGSSFQAGGSDGHWLLDRPVTSAALSSRSRPALPQPTTHDVGECSSGFNKETASPPAKRRPPRKPRTKPTQPTFNLADLGTASRSSTQAKHGANLKPQVLMHSQESCQKSNPVEQAQHVTGGVLGSVGIPHHDQATQDCACLIQVEVGCMDHAQLEDRLKKAPPARVHRSKTFGFQPSAHDLRIAFPALASNIPARTTVRTMLPFATALSLFDARAETLPLGSYSADDNPVPTSTGSGTRHQPSLDLAGLGTDLLNVNKSTLTTSLAFSQMMDNPATSGGSSSTCMQLSGQHGQLHQSSTTYSENLHIDTPSHLVDMDEALSSAIELLDKAKGECNWDP